MAINISGLFPDIYTVDPMLLPSGNPFIKCNKEVLSLQPRIPPKRFDIFSHLRSFFMGDGNDSKKQKNEISVANFCQPALWAPKHGNSALQKLRISVGGCFSLPTYRNYTKLARQVYFAT